MLDLPFFEDRHRELGAQLAAFAAGTIDPLAAAADAGDPHQAATNFLQSFAGAGLLKILVPDAEAARLPELRAVCLAREAIAASSGLADTVFAVQGLGSYPLLVAGHAELKRRYLPRIASGEAIAAFAATEPTAGSDLSALRTTARQDGDWWVLDGSKTLISNAGIASFYILFAREESSASTASRPLISAFLVDATTPGFSVSRTISLMAPHPIGDLALHGCRIPAQNRVGNAGDGIKLALTTLDFFRATVGAAGCGLAMRALREARDYVTRRRQFGTALSEFQATRFALADMQVELDAARLLVYRAAWLKDQGAARVSREASIAKLFATEAAHRIVDRAVQLHGGIGVERGVVVERLYREARALRIYEGTSEIQRLIIAEGVLKE
jgi:acyl-CoA dehydrogenase